LLLGSADSVSVAGLPQWLAAHPLSADRNIRAEVVAQTAAASAHIVQIRDREQPHIHAEHDATVVLWRGEGAIFLNAKPHGMQRGDAVVIPRGVPHYFVNLGDQPAVAFVTFAPAYDGKDQLPVPGP
jgi:quercetin dioxygenase-like cupin family protein